jgi:hypothetical protein
MKKILIYPCFSEIKVKKLKNQKKTMNPLKRQMNQEIVTQKKQQKQKKPPSDEEEY